MTYDPATQEQMAKLLGKLMSEPKTRRTVGKAIREVEPNVRFPDLDLEDLKEELRADREKEKADRETEKLEEKLRTQRDRLKDRYSDEQLKQIEEDVMKKHGIFDYEIAAKVYAAEQPPVRESREENHHGATWKIPNFEKYFKDPRGTALDEAHQAIAELRGQR